MGRGEGATNSLKLSLLHHMLQTCKRISVAGCGIEHGMTSLYLSTLETPSLSPHQNLQQTATHNSSLVIIIPIRNARNTPFNMSILYNIVQTCWGNKIYLMYSERESNSLDNKLFFFRPTTTCFKLSRDSLHILHSQFYRCQLDLSQFNIAGTINEIS